MGSRDTRNLKLLDELPDHPDGVKKWRIRFTYTDPKWKGGGHSRAIEKRYVGKLEQAQAERDHLRLYLKQGLDPDDFPRPHEQNNSAAPGSTSQKKSKTDKTFGEMVQIYRRQRKTENLAARTLQTENRILDQRMIPSIGNWVVQRVSLRDFQDLRLEWHQKHVEDEDLSPATVNKWIRAMKHYVGWCCRRLGVRHVCRDLKQLQNPKEKRGRAMPRSELETLLKQLESQYPHYYALCYLAAYTGQRFGTLAALKWSDINPDRRVIFFRKSKTGHQTSVPWSEFESVLEKHRQILKAWSPAAFEKSPYVFPCKGDPANLKGGGLRRDTSSINKALNRLCQQSGITKISFHDFRRTFVTLALEAGVAPDVIRSLTGHSEQMIGHYHHQSQESKRDLISVVKGRDKETLDEAKNEPSDQILTASEFSLA